MEKFSLFGCRICLLADFFYDGAIVASICAWKCRSVALLTSTFNFAIVLTFKIQLKSESQLTVHANINYYSIIKTGRIVLSRCDWSSGPLSCVFVQLSRRNYKIIFSPFESPQIVTFSKKKLIINVLNCSLHTERNQYHKSVEQSQSCAVWELWLNFLTFVD